jgi:hypothetical protein
LGFWNMVLDMIFVGRFWNLIKCSHHKITTSIFFGIKIYYILNDCEWLKTRNEVNTFQGGYD